MKWLFWIILSILSSFYIGFHIESLRHDISDLREEIEAAGAVCAAELVNNSKNKEDGPSAAIVSV